MYLKSLELNGFKSFPDRVVLKFDPGLTAVVGPNGSGKSNIVDAVRWVLGEQSSKTLRGNKMEDVIFSGTQTRPAAKFAAVTLHLADVSGTIGKTYGDTIAITRKLLRNGDSTYAVNGTTVRLRDITELFFDTGLGRDGYAIIGQGKIAEIVSAKSTDRREIFEEAAGISKFHHKKQEAQRRLASATENLVRLQDILNELNARLLPLREQAAKAKRYSILSEAEKSLEISIFVAESNDFQKKLAALSDEFSRVNQEYQNIETELQVAESKIQVGYRDMEEIGEQLQDFRQKCTAYDENSATLRTANAVAKNDIDHTKTQISTLILQQNDEKTRVSRLETQYQGCLQKQENLQNRRDFLEQQSAGLTEQKETLARDSQRLGDTYAAENQALQSYLLRQRELAVRHETTLSAREAAYAELERQNAARDSQMLRLQAQQNSTETANAREQQARAAYRAATKTYGEFEKKCAENKQAYAEAKAACDDLYFAWKDREQRRKMLQDMERSMEGISGSVRAVLRAENGTPRGVHGTLAGLLTLSPVYTVALETALGGALQDIVVDDADTAKFWIRYLAQHHAGRATFLPVTTIRGKILSEKGLEKAPGFVGIASELVTYDAKYTEIVRSLLGRIVVAENLDAANDIAKSYAYRFRVVTPDGQVIQAGGAFTGGSAQHTGGQLSRRAEIAALDAEFQELSRKKTAAEEIAAQLQDQMQANETELQALQSAVQNASSEMSAAHAQAARENDLLTQIQASFQAAEKEKSTPGDRVAELDDQLKKITDESQDIAEKITASQAVVSQHQAEADALSARQQAFSEESTQYQVAVAQYEKDVAALEADIARVTEARDTAQRNFSEHGAELEALRKKITDLEEKFAAATETIAQNTQDRRAAEESIRRLQERYNTRENEIRLTQEEIRTIQDTREKYAGEKVRLGERKNALQAQMEAAHARLFSQYSLTPEQARACAEPLRDISVARQELAQLKEEIRRLGSVNLAAIEEYKDVSQRYADLSAQVNDAKTAKAELERLIESLTQEMERRFSKSFRQIDRNFREIFRDLFGGGEGRLTLTDPEHILESGIEIQVAPPGKVIKNLISLSGGEQSFIAIAIYFAILKLHPSPFCILDEIDAALDEGNVQKYAQYLKKFTRTTQFILITHRRSAMEAAGVLYGVTMQENGISKLLRMSQDDMTGA